MKKIIYLIILVLLVSSCEKIKEKNLPEAARTFMSTYFPDETYLHGDKERDDGTTTYDVTLSNGIELEFDKSGNWTSIDCEFSLVPSGITSLLPNGITTYFITEYPDSKIMKISKEMGGFEIVVNDRAGKFKFNSNGEFISHYPEL